MIRFVRLAFCVAVAAGLAACSGGVPSVANVALQGGKDLNATAGTPTPVQVRLYQLKSTARFANADYFQLSDKETATLGDELVAREDTFVHPGQSTKIAITVKPGAQYLGIAAGFRDIDHATWRVTAPLKSNMPITLSGDKVQVAAK